jgi:hypothetical protein
MQEEDWTFEIEQHEKEILKKLGDFRRSLRRPSRRKTGCLKWSEIRTTF